MKVIEGLMAAPEAKVAIVVARFNSFINDSLVAGALDVLKRQGQVKDDNITLVRVPGAVEIALACKAGQNRQVRRHCGPGLRDPRRHLPFRSGGQRKQQDHEQRDDGL